MAKHYLIYKWSRHTLDPPAKQHRIFPTNRPTFYVYARVLGQALEGQVHFFLSGFRETSTLEPPMGLLNFVRYALGSGLGWAGSWPLPRFLDRCHLSYSDGSNLIKSEARTKSLGRVQSIVTTGPSEETREWNKLQVGVRRDSREEQT